MGAPSKWQPRREEMERLLAEGYNLVRLAEYYGETYAATSNAAKRFGLRVRPDKRSWNSKWPGLREDMGYWINAGLTQKDIADMLDVSVAAVSNAMSRLGLKVLPDARRRVARANLDAVRADPELEAKRLARLREAMTDDVRAVQAEALRKATAKRSAQARAKRDEAALRERLAAMTPFERQLELVRLGRADVQRKVDLRKAVADITLGGVASFDV